MRLAVAALIALAAGLPAHAETPPPSAAEAVFAGGCFWCVEADFEKLTGVYEAVSGYTGGTTDNPTYKQVSYGDTGHYEAVKVYYDPEAISYADLVESFWPTIDPTDPSGQFCDRGDSYRTAIFVASPEERAIAEASVEALAASGRVERVVTPVLDLGAFTDAEAFHQNYYKSEDKLLTRFGYVSKKDAYAGYRRGCGRDARLSEVWGEATN